MEPEEAAHIFERFYRSDPSRSRAHGGAGLGLSIVSAIVAAHGGTVSAEGRVGEGSTFTVHLPPCPPDEDQVIMGDERPQLQSGVGGIGLGVGGEVGGVTANGVDANGGSATGIASNGAALPDRDTAS
jgi:two-component system OmpR family sensor kinase